MDIWTKKKRSEVMSKILGRDTKPEIVVRKMLFSMGYRFRLHGKGMPGKPDIVLRKYNAIIFIHGCFWHLHGKCRDGAIPKTRTAFWRSKLYGNKERDRRNLNTLRRSGWKVLKLWECEIEKKPKRVVKKIETFLKSGKHK